MASTEVLLSEGESCDRFQGCFDVKIYILSLVQEKARKEGSGNSDTESMAVRQILIEHVPGDFFFIYTVYKRVKNITNITKTEIYQ